MKKTVSILTLGCRVNQYESCAIAEALENKEFKINKHGKSDFYIINTCAVTAESERKSRQMVRRCASQGKVLVLGCASQIESEFFLNLENVIYVGGNRSKLCVVEFLCEYSGTEKAINVNDLKGSPYENMQLCGTADLFSECRAFIKIQDGCNGKCTYCIIPKCRGSVCSRAKEDIVDEAKRLAQRGYRELILTGIEVGAYNCAPLASLIEDLSDISGIERLRLGSLSPNIITKQFLKAAKASNIFMPHIHLSIQSCCDRILRLMKRPYTKQDVFERVGLIRDYMPNCMISADIIVGFPGETDEEFMETVDALKVLNIYHVHSFPYSERKGTPAAEMPESVPKKIRSERNAYLSQECSKIRAEILNAFVGKTVSVLIEKKENDYCFGHTAEFIEAKFKSNEHSVGEIVNIQIDTHDGTVLNGYAVGMEVN